MAQKWLNSLNLVKQMGDVHNLDKDRYRKLNVYSKTAGRIVFKDLELLIDEYETKLCSKIVKYKYSKIFISTSSDPIDVPKIQIETTKEEPVAPESPCNSQKSDKGKQSKFGKFKTFVSKQKDKVQ